MKRLCLALAVLAIVVGSACVGYSRIQEIRIYPQPPGEGDPITISASRPASLVVQSLVFLKSSIPRGMSPREYAKQQYGFRLKIDGILVTPDQWYVKYRPADGHWVAYWVYRFPPRTLKAGESYEFSGEWLILDPANPYKYSVTFAVEVVP